MVEVTKWMENREAYHGLDEDQQNYRRKKKITKEFDKQITHYLAQKEKAKHGYELPGKVKL